MISRNASVVSVWSGDMYPANAHLPLSICAQNLCEIASYSRYAPPESDTKSFLESSQQKSNLHTKYGLVLAISNNVVIGFLEARLVSELAEIDFVAVHPSQQRNGFGRALVNTAIQAATHYGAEKILLEVGRENQGAIALYSSLGFNQIAVRKNYYRGSEDALILEYSKATAQEKK